MDIANAESAYLEGTTRYDDWLAEFELQWNQPIIEAQAAEVLHSMDPITRELLDKMMPKEMRELEKKYGGSYAKRKKAESPTETDQAAIIPQSIEAARSDVVR